VVQMVGHVPCKGQALRSVPRVAKTKSQDSSRDLLEVMMSKCPLDGCARTLSSSHTATWHGRKQDGADLTCSTWADGDTGVVSTPPLPKASGTESFSEPPASSVRPGTGTSALTP
jgi:hypothetical protein